MCVHVALFVEGEACEMCVHVALFVEGEACEMCVHVAMFVEGEACEMCAWCNVRGGRRPVRYVYMLQCSWRGRPVRCVHGAMFVEGGGL